jgi:hypothetical protein
LVDELRPENVEPGEPVTFRSLATRRVLITLANYAFTVFMESATSAILPLLYASPISYGGLGLSSFSIGIIMSISGLLLGLSSLLFFPLLSRKLGLTHLYRVGFAGFLIVQALYALMNVLARRSGRVDGFVWAVLALQLYFNQFSVMAFSRSSHPEGTFRPVQILTNLHRLHVLAYQRCGSEPESTRNHERSGPNCWRFVSHFRALHCVVAFLAVGAA